MAGRFMTTMPLRPLVLQPVHMVVEHLQHDRTLMREVPGSGLIQAMEADASINMISLLTKSTMHHAARVRGRLAQIGSADVLTQQDWEHLTSAKHVCRLRFLPLMQWLDSTHLARVRSTISGMFMRCRHTHRVSHVLFIWTFGCAARVAVIPWSSQSTTPHPGGLVGVPERP
jgi:hypothetical protein